MSTQRSAAEQARLIEALGATAFAVMAVLSKLAAQNDVSLTQVRMIGILHDHRLTITELSAALGLDRSSVSGLVDRTEKRGLIRREPNPRDARSVLVTVSPAGSEAFAAGAAEVAQELSTMTAALKPAEVNLLVTLLERMLAHRVS